MASLIHYLRRWRQCFLLFLLLFTGYNSLLSQALIDLQKVTFAKEDQGRVDEVLVHFSDEKEAATSTLMANVGVHFLGTPYKAHTLEMDSEQLLINVREMDCTTFAEYCLALAGTIQSAHPTFEQFAAELQQIRYRDGVIEGYPSRLHYFCDWIYNNEQKGLIKDMSNDIANTPLLKQISFMSNHPDSYRQLKEDPSLVEVIALQEKEISRRNMYYIPESMVSEVEGQLMEGDIVGITTGAEGLAISHVGILVMRSGRIHLLHASSAAKKVVVSEQTLVDYLVNSKSATGIMVARPN
jgi:hypothetical protein